jgi:hypothetical protein
VSQCHYFVHNVFLQLAINLYVQCGSDKMIRTALKLSSYHDMCKHKDILIVMFVFQFLQKKLKNYID